MSPSLRLTAALTILGAVVHSVRVILRDWFLQAEILPNCDIVSEMCVEAEQFRERWGLVLPLFWLLAPSIGSLTVGCSLSPRERILAAVLPAAGISIVDCLVDPGRSSIGNAVWVSSAICFAFVGAALGYSEQSRAPCRR